MLHGAGQFRPGKRSPTAPSNGHGHVLAAEHGLPAFDFAHYDVVGGVDEIRDPAVVERAVRRVEQLRDARVDSLELLRT